MTDKHSIKVDDETWDRLKDAKGKYETWNQTLQRLLDGDPPDPQGGY